MEVEQSSLGSSDWFAAGVLRVIDELEQCHGVHPSQLSPVCHTLPVDWHCFVSAMTRGNAGQLCTGNTGRLSDPVLSSLTSSQEMHLMGDNGKI